MSPKKAPRKKTKKAAKKRAPAKGQAKKRSPTKEAARPSGAGAKGRAAPPALRPVPLYEFEAGGLRGYVRLADPDRGIEFSECLEGKSLPSPCREVLSLRHYLARGDGGLLVPREGAACNASVAKEAVLFKYDKAPKWPIAATARYELLPEGGVDVTFAFTLSKGMKGFEAGVETLMPARQSNTYVHASGRWVHAVAGPRLQRFYPRNMGAAELIADGRWNGLRMAGIGLSVEPQGYDYPMIAMWDQNSEWALAYMALTEECSSIWLNGAERTVGLGLVGADVKPRSTATCRVRALLCQAAQLDDVIPYYREFVREARTTRRR